MTLNKKTLLAIGLTVCLMLVVPPAWGVTPPPNESFVVFDATLYSNKPDLSEFGIQPIAIAYAGSFGSDWAKQADRLPDIVAVQARAREAKIKSKVAVLDIEHWPLTGSPDVVQASLNKYKTVLEWFKAAAPNLLIGYYGVVPIRDYWRAIKDRANEERRVWMSENDRFLPIASTADILFPSIYTFYPDREGWKKYAIAQIEEARRLGKNKPVYVFMMPVYHDSNRSLGTQYLPGEYWKFQLETARQYADGIVIWGGWGSGNRPAPWDEYAEWWKVTKNFLARAS